jgi:hypothetical protein
VKLSRSIFDSGSEREVFRALEQRWSEKLRLYPQLPLSKIVVLEPTDRLSDGERRTFFATNVDYTFCDQRDRPLFSIEFDGIGGGFDRDGQYQQARATSDPYRKLKMDFKLRVTRDLGYPLLVVSFDELETIDAKDSLTILDGIVARFVVMREEPKLIEQLLDDNADLLSGLQPWEADDVIQDLVLQAGVLAEMENDPLERARWDALADADRYGLSGGHSTTWLYDPPLAEPDGIGPFGISPDLVLQRAAGMNRADRVGCCAIVDTPLGEVTRTVWLRNVGRSAGLMMEFVAENAALMLAFRHAASRMSEYIDPQ